MQQYNRTQAYNISLLLIVGINSPRGDNH